MFWWKIKVILGLCLIIYTVIDSAYGLLNNFFIFAYGVEYGLIVVGVFIHLYHYYLLKRKNPRVQEPDILLNSEGLFRWIRHPMYLGDLFFYFGFCLLNPDAVTCMLFSCSVVAIMQQVKVEDVQLQKYFGHDFVDWSKTTRRIIPFVY